MTKRSHGAGLAPAGLSLALCLGVLAGAIGETGQPGGADKDPVRWKSLFDGKSLAGWKKTNFGGEGEVSVEGGTILMEQGNDMTGITYARADFPTTDYEVTLEGKRLQGNDFFCTTTFPVGDDHCSLVVGVTRGRITAWIDEEKVVDLATADRKISVRAECEPCKPFGIATWRTTGAVRDIRVRTLSADEKKAAGGK
jgi:hypothetical protein